MRYVKIILGKSSFLRMVAQIMIMAGVGSFIPGNLITLLFTKWVKLTFLIILAEYASIKWVI